MIEMSFLDKELLIGEQDGVVAVFKIKKNQNIKNDDIFLMIQETNNVGERIFKRFDYIKDNKANKFILEKQEIVAKTPEDAKNSFLNLVGNANILGQGISLRKYQIKNLENHLQKFQDIPNKYIGRYSDEPEYEPDCGLGFNFSVHKPTSLLNNEKFLLFRDILTVFKSENPDIYSRLEFLLDSKYESPIFIKSYYRSGDFTSQLHKFQQVIEGLKHNDYNNSFHIVISYLDKLNSKLRGDYCNNPATPYLLNLFTDFSQNLNELHNDAYREIKLLHRINLLADRLDEKATELNLHEPMHKGLKVIICGIIGAVVGLAIGATIGACVTAWSGGFAALPAAIIGAGKGFALGTTIGLSASGIGGFLGSLFGYQDARKKQQAYEPNARQLALINETKNEVKKMLVLTNKNQTTVQPVEEKMTHMNLKDQPEAIAKIKQIRSSPKMFENDKALTDNAKKWIKKASEVKDIGIPEIREKWTALNKGRTRRFE